jgi:hypothetical protein
MVLFILHELLMQPGSLPGLRELVFSKIGINNGVLN